MSVCDGKCEYYPAPRDKEIKNPNTRTTGGYKPLSEKIVDSFDPQKIFKPSTLSSTATLTKNTREDKATGGFNASGINNNIETSKTLGIYDSDYAIYFLIVSIIAAIIMLAMAKMFFGVMFMFVGRVVGLYMTMIFSPFAVLTRGGMPLVGNIKELSWDTWLKDLTNYALLAPIFVFFLYIIYAFINSDFLSILNLRESDGFMDTVITIAVPMIIIYMLIAQGVGIAKKYAGKAGEMIQGFASKATGLIGGAALGVGALTGARVIGGAAKAVNESKAGRWLRDKAPDSAIARMSLRGLDKAAKSSWDVRQSELGKSGLKSLGINSNPKGLNALAGIGLGLGTDQRKGGFEADVKRRKEDKVKTGKLFEEKMSDPQIDAYNKRQNKKYEDKKNKIEEEALMKKDNLNKKELEDLKKTNPTSYNTKKAEALAATPSAQTEIDNIAKPKEMKSSKEVNTDRKKQYVSNLASGSFLGKVPVVGTLVGAGVRDRGDQEASKEIKKEVEKGEKEAIKKAATEKLVSDLGDKLEKLEGKDGLGGELKKFNENLSAILTEEASQHGDFRGRDIKTLTSEEKFELVERRETRMAGRLGVLEADHAKAIEEYKKNNTPQNKANLVNAVKAMKEEEKRISKARDLMEKSSKTEGDIVKTKKDKLQAEERLENMEYRKERKESEEKKNKGGDTKEKPAAEAKPKDETK